jgi:enterochelin esterase family protein
VRGHRSKRLYRDDRHGSLDHREVQEEIAAAAAPFVSTEGAAFTLSDPDRALRRVELVHELVRPRRIPFERRGDEFGLELPRPPANRLEYLLEIEERDGGTQFLPDPDNPLQAPGPFGAKSVIEFPEYHRPAWVDDDESPAGSLGQVTLRGRLRVNAIVWTAAEATDGPLPLLLVHDGPEYAEYSSLLRLLDHLVAFGELPPFRAALLPPPLNRNETYSASARYARALVQDWLPQLQPYEGRPVLMGASLGGLAALHAHWTHPEAFSGLFLQSGSFFRRRLDPQESGSQRFARITRFVSRVFGGRGDVERIPVTLTCGTAEENLGNNRAVAAALQRQGWPAVLVEHPDAHNWTSWRDSFHPHLAELFLRAAG